MLRKLSPLVLRLLSSTAPATLNIATATTRHYSDGRSVYEPDYLESLKPKFPQYSCLDVQIKGYDYPILESYQRYLHSIAEYLDIDVSDCYALPPQTTKVQRLRPNSAIVDAEYRLTVYERNLQINDVNAPIYPVFLRIAQAALPAGVQLSVQEHSEELEERRYVPDRDLLDLKAELGRMQTGNMGGPKKK
ncbi:39S ribosomal protein L48, mitochondrial [Rhagoletis pomonella]|uniref:39S ribosomal protein L48, mitochondrial n=1 Tax=Rhagoletis pomonella TaxID=28610 RepID=UPI0017801D18|nr:39S ribosomal protein L48, mitochondrial [Rhagoletis pomonella]